MKRFAILLVSVLCLASFLLTGCKPKEPDNPGVKDEVTSPYHKYSQTLNMKVGQWIGDEKNFPEGMTPSDNALYTLVKEYINIQLETAVTVPAGPNFYDQIANLQMGDSLPDFTAMDAATFASAIEAEQLADLTEIFEKLASPTLKRILNSNNGIYMDLGSRDGRLYGIPRPATILDGVEVAWIRKDWIALCGWKNAQGGIEPRTYEELEALAYAFRDNIDKIAQATGVNNPYPMAFYKDFGTPYMGIMNAHGAYPGTWMEDGANGVKYGTFTDETLAVLKKLNKYQSDRIFQADWATKETTTIASESAQGRVGIFIDEFWGSIANQVKGLMGIALSDNPGKLAGADWIAVPMPAAGGKTMRAYSKADPLEYYVVNKNYPNPEAAIILMNYIVEKYNAEGTAENKLGAYFPYEVAFKEIDNTYPSRSIFNWLPVIIDDPQKNVTYSDLICEALETGDPSKLSGEIRTYYDYITGNPTTAADRLTKWSWNMVYGPDGGVQAAKKLIGDLHVSAYMGAPTPAMTENFNKLNLNIELPKITLMICTAEQGQIESAFENLREQWNKNGGSKIIQEINQIKKG